MVVFMLINRLFSKLFNSTSFLTVSGVLLTTSLISPSWAMTSEEEMSHSSFFQKRAPFSVEEILEHAKTAPDIYEMEYLQSSMGKKHIQRTTDAINEGNWPQKSGLKEVWNGKRLNYKKSLVADWVSQEFQRELSDLSPDQKIVKIFQTQELIQENTQSIKTIYPNNSSNTKKVIFVKEKNGDKLALKVFKDTITFEIEKEKLSAEKEHIKIVKEYAKKYNKKLPILMEYQGAAIVEEDGVIQLSKAKGKTFTQLVEQLNEKSTEQIKETSTEQIKETFNNIGLQFGHLDSLLYVHNSNQILIHPDSHEANFTYDEKTKQLYWIDTAGLHFQNQQPDINHFKFAGFLNIAALNIGNKLLAQTCSIQEIKQSHTTIKNLLLASKALYEGYGRAMKEHSLSLVYFVCCYERFFNRFKFDWIEKVNLMFETNKLSPISYEEDIKINLD